MLQYFKHYYRCETNQSIATTVVLTQQFTILHLKLGVLILKQLSVTAPMLSTVFKK